MINVSSKLYSLTSRDFRTSIAFVLLSFLAGGINYLYYPLMARILSVSDFGASQALITILTQAGSVFAGLSLLTIFLVRKVPSHYLTKMIDAVQKLIVSTLFLLTIVLMIFHHGVASFLNLSDNLNLFIVAFDLIVSVPFVVTFGFLLAQKRFIPAIILQITIVTIKLITGGALAYYWGPTGALLGIGIGYVLGMITFWLCCKMIGADTWSHSSIRAYLPPSWDDLRQLSSHGRPILAIIIVSTLLVIFPSYDVLIARHFLAAHDSGLYAAASTLSSLLLFASLPLINMLIPLLDADSITKSLPQIKKALLFISFISVLLMIIFFVFPTFILGLFGAGYTRYASILWLFGVNMFFVCVMTGLLQALVLYLPLVSFLSALITMSSLLIVSSFFHDNPRTIITATLTVYGSMILLTLLTTGYLLRTRLLWRTKTN